MGHVRLGTLPDTAPWRRVVALLADDAEVDAVAQATSRAAHEGLEKARNDAGLVYCVWLLTQLVQAAQQDNFAPALREAGFSVADQPSVFDLATAFSVALDRHLHQRHCRTDIGEMAQLAAVESLVYLVGQRSAGLFERTHEDVHRAAAGLANPKGFATLVHDFFARFCRRFLCYHLSRELSEHVGGNGRFAAPEEHTAFLEQLAVHCQEAAAIMHDFAAGWYDKARSFGQEITQTKVRGFVGHAMTKLEGELELRGQRHG
jgi:hypothetical protein